MDMLKKLFLTIFLAAGLVVGAQETAPTLLEQAEAEAIAYDTEAARVHLEKYRATFGRGRGKKQATQEQLDEIAEVEGLIERVETMLERVERIVVVDSLVVDADAFFRHYSLSPEAGLIGGAEAVPKGNGAVDPVVVYTTDDGSQRIWAAADDDDMAVLVSASHLSDGSWEKPVALGGDLGEGGDCNYPFLMPDGLTLYYANDGYNSLGGYDIYITRYDGEQWLSPQNVGMPYNSPYDDYMMAIDETTGVGWWATDRNQIPGKVTIYAFIVSDTRQNYPDDTPGLASLALVENLRDTWTDGENYEGYLARLAKETKSASKEVEFTFSLPGGRVCHSLDDFRSSAAREAMEDYLQAQAEMNTTQNELATLRARYAKGDRSVKSQILKMEDRLKQQREEAKRRANEVAINER